MQILLTPAIHTSHCPHPSAMANPMALVPASFLPCLPHPLKIPSSYPYSTPCSVSHCLGSLPLSWGEGADPAARVSVSAAAAGVEQAGLPPPREPSYNLPHHLPQALFFRCSGHIPEEECLSCGQIRILAAVLGASSCLSGSNVSMDCSSLWQIPWKNTAEKWFPKSDFIAFCLPRRQAPQLSQCIRLHTAVRVTWAVTPDKMPAGRHISLSSGHHVEAENPADTAKHRGVWFPGSHTQKTQLASRVVWCISNTETQRRSRGCCAAFAKTRIAHSKAEKCDAESDPMGKSQTSRCPADLKDLHIKVHKGSSHRLKSTYLTGSYKITITS